MCNELVFQITKLQNYKITQLLNSSYDSLKSIITGAERNQLVL